MSFFRRTLGKSSDGAERRAGTAPVIAAPFERGFDKEYRRPDDPAHVVRINQHPPKGLPKKFAEYAMVAGISQDEVRSSAGQFMAGSERRVELEADPENEYDVNAIKVIGVWRDALGALYRARIGWVPAEIARKIAEAGLSSQVGATIEALYKARDDKGPGVRIDIWCPRARRAQ